MAWTRAPAQLAFLLVLPVARALRASSGCLGLSAGAFPLNVDQLLSQSSYSKAKYFAKLRAMGINSSIRMTEPTGLRLPNTCLAQPGKPRQHVIFLGDCMERMSYAAYLRNEGHELAAKRSARIGEDFRGHHFVRGTTASYILWWSTSTLPLEKMQRFLREQQLDPAKDTVVLWMGSAIWGWFGGDKRWVQPQARAAMLTDALTNASLALPGVRLVWDSPSYIDLPLMGANPPKSNYAGFKPANVKIVDELTAIDKATTARMRVPLTQRHFVGSIYRGLQCDGVHADPHLNTHSERWGCGGFEAYEDLVLQGGLYPACKQQNAPYCLQRGR